jgi:DNA-binding Lrp family transcriptional regulator
MIRQSYGNSHILDKLDYQIINLMISGFDNSDISDELRISLSTTQRRVRHLILFGYVDHIFRPNYKKLGLKKGLLVLTTFIKQSLKERLKKVFKRLARLLVAALPVPL